MKLTKIVFAIAFILFAGAVEAQSLDKVLKEHFEAVGQNKMAKVESVKMNGKILQMGLEIPFTAYQARPNKMRTEGTFQGMTFIQTYNGETGWNVNPFAGSTEAQPMGPDELKAMKTQSDMDGMLFDYAKKGYKVQLLEDEEVEGTPCFALEILTPDEDKFIYYIDNDSYMCIKIASTVDVQGNKSLSETFMSNFKEVDGVVFPGSIETRYDGQSVLTMVFESIELNAKLESSLFEKPM